MGQFSFISVDTKTRIYCDGQGDQTVTMVYMDGNGTVKTVSEASYQGFGMFGGLDYYSIMGKMNRSKIVNDLLDDVIREKGIDLFFDETLQDTVFPQLYLGIPVMSKVNFFNRVMDDPNQGCYRKYDIDGFDA